MSLYIPAIRDNEVARLSILMKNKEAFWSVIFDGTPRRGDCVAIVVRVCIHFVVHQKLVSLPTLASSPDATDLAGIVFKSLVVRYGLDEHDLKRCRAFIHDSAAVNHAATEVLFSFTVISNAVSMTCMSHVMDNCGKALEYPLLKKFVETWFVCFQR